MKSLGAKVFPGFSALLVSISVLPVSSVAQGIEFDLGNGRVRIQDRDDGYRRYERRYDDRYDRRRDFQPGCPIRSALVIGGRHLRDPQIASVTRRYIIVDGYGRRGERNQVVIQNDMSCRRVG